MARKSYKVSTPGSLMLMGEHAVLRGYSALVAAVDKRMTVSVTLRADKQIMIESSLGTAAWSLDALPESSTKFKFLLAVLKMLAPRLKQGVDIKIQAEFSDQMGFGSSAAVVVGSLAALMYVIEDALPQTLDLFAKAKEIIRQVQGFGSGADAAASIFGGVLRLVGDDSVEVIAETVPLTVLYSGSKCPTTTVVGLVNQREASAPQETKSIFEAMQQGVLDSAEAIKQQDWQTLGKIADDQQELMRMLGVSNDTLDNLIASLRKTPGIFGAKISGSGLGDCLIGIGSSAGPRVLTQITQQGIEYEVQS